MMNMNEAQYDSKRRRPRANERTMFLRQLLMNISEIMFVYHGKGIELFIRQILMTFSLSNLLPRKSILLQLSISLSHTLRFTCGNFILL